jgi:hypothetical protein
VSANTELAPVPPKETALAVYSAPKGLEPWLQKIRTEIDGFTPDISTRKGRDAIERIRLLAVDLDGITAEDLADRIQKLEAVAMGADWQEFEPEAARAKDKALGILRTALSARQQYEDEQAELARLRKEKEERDKRDHEERIAREAAERATREAEEKAQRARDAEAQRARDEKAAAEKRENDLKLQAAESERLAEQAKREKLEAEQKAERDRLAAVEREKQAVEQARLDEIARQKAAADEILRQERLREQDKEHRRSINLAALQAFVKGGMTEECAKQAITLIASRQIPAISIQY